ncbi:uncharacterized protein C5orf52-like [Ambystoma mexicanum]|uniref:uncharacterized protein C5orf52-like n=1 Tax=Ambystoma mexicanum TaxID=8296 RepID=UPI0037E74700
MSQEEDHGPIVTFCKRRGSGKKGISSLSEGGELKTKGGLKRSSVCSVIMHDNNNEQRILNLQIERLENLKKKTYRFYDNLKKRFINDRQKRSVRWEKEHDTFMKSLGKEQSIFKKKALEKEKKAKALASGWGAMAHTFQAAVHTNITPADGSPK